MPRVDFREVAFRVAGRQNLSEVSISIETGETLMLLSRSRSGNSTALKLTKGMLFPTGGARG